MGSLRIQVRSLWPYATVLIVMPPVHPSPYPPPPCACFNAMQVLMPSASHTLEVPVTLVDGLQDLVVHVSIMFPDAEVRGIFLFCE